MNKITTMYHTLGNKVLEYDVDSRGIIVDEREYDKHTYTGNKLPNWVTESMEFWYDVKKQDATNESLSANPQLTDFSGKDRPMQLYNFAFSGMSGVNGYLLDFLGWYAIHKAITVNKYTVVVNGNLNNPEAAHFGGSSTNAIIKSNTLIRISNLIDGNKVEILCKTQDGPWLNLTDTKVITTDGIYEIVEHDETGINNLQIKFYEGNYSNTVIEILPKYPNALVTDGVDDYGMLRMSLNVSVKTIFFVANIFEKGSVLIQTLHGLNVSGIGIPWYGGSATTPTYVEISYINGVPNDNIITDVDHVLNKKQIITNVSNDVYNDRNWSLFTNVDLKTKAKCAFYSAIGFNRVLTQEEIKWVIDHMIDKTDIDMNLIPNE